MEEGRRRQRAAWIRISHASDDMIISDKCVQNLSIPSTFLDRVTIHGQSGYGTGFVVPARKNTVSYPDWQRKIYRKASQERV